jgi:hypothetical protein
MYVSSNTEELSTIIFGVKKQKILHVCVCDKRECVPPGAWSCACSCVHVAILIQNATRMRHIVAPFLVHLAPSGFSTILHKRHDNITCVLIFSTNCV